LIHFYKRRNALIFIRMGDHEIREGGFPSLKEKVKLALKMISIEPALFMMTFSFGLTMVINQNLIIDKVCRDLGYSQAICIDIDSHPEEDDNVQTRVSQINMGLNIFAAIPSIILALFIGPWSDKNGRKPLIILPIVGAILSNLVWILNVIFRSASAYFLLGTSLSTIFGGFTTLLIGMYSYLADISSIQARTTRIAIIDVFMLGGMPAGVFLSAYVYKYLGFHGNYGIAILIQIAIIIYIIIFVKDTRGPNSDYEYSASEYQSTGIMRYLSIVDLQHVTDVFEVTFKKRNNKLRRVIILLIALMLLNITIFSDGGVMYLYVRKKFKWTEQEYTKFTTCTIIVAAIAAFIMMPLLAFYWKVHDALIGVIAAISKVSSLVVISIAQNAWVLFLGACLGFLSSLASIVIRSILSKCVSKSELGKVYSVLASLEAAVPLFASPLFTFVYSATLESFLGAVFILQAGLFSICGLGFLYVYFILTRSGQDYALMVEEESRHNEQLPDEQRGLLENSEASNAYGT